MSTPYDRRPAVGDAASFPPPAKAAGVEDDAYSATVLASHWIQRPDDHDATPWHASDAPQAGDATGSPPHSDATVLRFGPGVTAALSHGMNRTLADASPPARPRRRPRRHVLPALVLVAALVFLLWRDHSPPSVTVRGVTVTTVERSTGCDGTADVVGVVRADGPGELSYRWVRNDGTASAVLHASVARGRQQVRLHLLWTFQGRGHYAAAAELRLLSPTPATAKVDFVYDCP